MKIQNRSRICLCISAAIMVIALVMSIFGMGINFGIDFAGGLNIQYNMGAAFEQTDIEEASRRRASASTPSPPPVKTATPYRSACRS